MKKIALLTLAIVTIAFSSCTIEKRQYMRGYHVEWKHKAPEVGGNGQAANKELNKSEEIAPMAETKVDQAEQSNVVESTSVAVNTNAAQPIANVVVDKPTRKERKEVTREVKKALVESKSYTSSSASISTSEAPASEIKKMDTPSTGVLVLIAFFIPPLAVYLYEGDWTSRCTTNLILTLLCGLPGFIHALVLILGKK